MSDEPPTTAGTRVVSLRSGRSGSTAVRVRLDDDGPDLIIPDTVAANLSEGMLLSPIQLERLRTDGARWSARDAALSLLSYRARSRNELEDRLHRKGFDAGLIASTLDRLEAEGYLDDGSFAASFARDRIRFRPRGRRRLAAELRHKGVDPATAERAIEEAMEEEDVGETDLARTAAERWARRATDTERDALCGRGSREERERARRRFYGYMARRGFASHHIGIAREGLCR